MEKETIEHYIVESLKELVKRDSDIFKQKIPKLGNSTEKERKLNRDLHETTLNHRFAFYLENILIKNNFLDYNVDIDGWIYYFKENYLMMKWAPRKAQ